MYFTYLCVLINKNVENMSKTVQLSIRMSEQERDTIAKAALEAGVSTTDYAKSKLLAASTNNASTAQNASTKTDNVLAPHQKVFSDSLDGEGLAYIGEVCRALWTGRVTNPVANDKKPYSPENPYRKIQLALNYYYKGLASKTRTLRGNMDEKAVKFINDEVR